ncbi:hypothetical protein GCM10010399_60850 [Dactylosporangium fulvum]|uniref:Ankyrin repeat protein n=1 Tax=Dactylosporangium fulvum TaxID=53359 RepID=A0ABY5VZV7_9ACTN|nr:ankyrin repeat domain-containing protein [Dactylosporangium fulvum]UWP83252.1 hypothetical protein Dfulv_02810 [Dactylosporangium fulvum]
MLTVLRRDLPQWQRIRAEALPMHAVEAAATARAAGDWRRAAEIARTDVDVDLDDVRRRFGDRAALAVEDDLRHLCLDLLWWHLPRHQGGMTTLQARVSAILAPAAGADSAPLVKVRLPKSPTGPQRLQVSVTTMAELADERWYVAPRYTWDVREAKTLRAAWGGSDERMPLLTRDGRPLPPEQLGVGDDRAAATERLYRQLAEGDLIGAWQACGVDVSDVETESLQRKAASPTCPIGVADQARAAARAFGVEQVNTLYGATLDLTVDGMTAKAADLSEYLEVPVRVATAPVPIDLVLIAAGRQRPADLHPLMREALFPGVAFPSAPVVSRPRAEARPARVRCQGVWHRVGVVDGALRLHDHDDTEQLRERALRSLGGQSSGCFAVQQGWTTGAARVPWALEAQRRAISHRMLHGDIDWLLDGLDRGAIDPQMRDYHGWSLLHMAMWVDVEKVLPVLLDAGLPVDTRDRAGRTPLYLAVMNGGSPELMRRLLAAGADPRAETLHGAYPSYVARSRNGWQNLDFLAKL